MARFFLGIDGGGTRCRARLRDEQGRLVGQGLGGPANIRADFDGSVASIRSAFAQAAAGLVAGDIYAGLGLAGSESAPAMAKLAATSLPFTAITIINDAHAACLGAHGGADGGIVICGTGSAGFAMVGGQTHVIGGWGFELGDAGSGALIGREAIRAAVLAIDGLGPASPLTAELLSQLGCDKPTLTEWARMAKPAHYAKFAPDVYDFADRGDPVAAAIIGRAVADIATIARRLVALGARKLTLLGGMAEPMQGRLPQLEAEFVSPLTDAADGAIMAARLAAGLPADVPHGASP